MNRLISISFSHYCEKARWALERAGIAYEERCYPPLLHYRAVARYRTRSVPVLVHAQGVLTDSTDILRWADQQAPCGLYPADSALRAAVDRWEDRFDETLGPATRQHVYAFGFGTPELMMGPATERVGWFDRLLVPRILPRARRMFDRLLDLSPAGLQGADEAIDATLDAVAAAMDGRQWLVGDQFTAADLTFACMMAPIILPANYGVRLPGPAEVSAAYRNWIARRSQHPAVEFARRLWAEER